MDKYMFKRKNTQHDTISNDVVNNDTVQHDTIQYNVLCLGGGGVKGFIQLGALYYLHNNNYLQHIDTYVGTSIGAVFSVLLAIGMNPLDIFHVMYKYNGQVLDTLSLNSIINYTKYKGFLDIYDFVSYIESIIKDRVGYIPTLEDIEREYNKRVIITATSLSTSACIYIDSSMDINITKALCMSCCIPFIFMPIYHEGNWYVDGGITDNYPIRYATKYGTVIGLNNITDNKNINDTIQQESLKNTIQYMFFVINLSLRSDNTAVDSPHKNISLCSNDVHSTDFFLTSTFKYTLFINGYNMCFNSCTQ